MTSEDRGDNQSSALPEIAVTPALVSGVIDLRAAPSPDALVQFFASILEDSDRAVPILCFAYIENEIGDLLRDAMRSDSRVNDLLGLRGPLGAAGAQIMLAHALGWIDDDTEADLTILRKIRNYFAHGFVRRGLDDPKVVSWIASHRKLPQWGPTGVLTGDTNRGRYLFAAALTAWHVMGQLHALPIVSRFHGLIDPDLIMQRGAEHRPRNLKALDDAFGKLLFLIAYVEGDSDWIVHHTRRDGFLVVDPGQDTADFLQRLADGTLEFDGPDWFRTESNIMNEEE